MQPPRLEIDVPGIDQIGIVVEDLPDAMDRFGGLFGIERWDVFDFEPPRLTDTRYRDATTEQAWRLSLASLGEMDLELIEPLRGENTFTAAGPGLHHVACFSFDEPASAVDRFVDAGMPVRQRGRFVDGTFWYLDVGEDVLLEIVDLGDGVPEPDRTYAPT